MPSLCQQLVRHKALCQHWYVAVLGVGKGCSIMEGPGTAVPEASHNIWHHLWFCIPAAGAAVLQAVWIHVPAGSISTSSNAEGSQA